MATRTTISKSDLAKVFLLRFLGYFLILSAFTGFILTFLPVIKVEISYRWNLLTDNKFTLEEKVVPDNKLIAKKSSLPLVQINPVNRQFAAVIPKINANSTVIANVDAGNEAIYSQALRQGVAHAAGTAYPGEIGNSFLFAHSSGNPWEISQYNSVFFLLKELIPGDEIYIFFNGKRYLYIVNQKIVVDPDQVQFLNIQTNFPQLTLQTCWPPGTALKRLLVLARLKEN